MQYIYLMKPTFSIFLQTIRFSCTFLAIFQSFNQFVSFIFDKLPSPQVIFQKML